MENFEGGHNPEIKDKRKLGWKAKIGLATAALFGSSNVTDSTPKVETPNPITSGEPPKPGTSTSATGSPKNL